MTTITLPRQVVQAALDALERCTKYDQRDYDAMTALSAALEQPQAEPAPVPSNEIQLNIVRKWPDGFQGRLERVWIDLIGFAPNYKLFDLQRALDGFGFTMKVYEGAAPAPSESAQPSPISFDAWFASPYTRVWEKSFREDYVANPVHECALALLRGEVRDALAFYANPTVYEADSIGRRLSITFVADAAIAKIDALLPRKDAP